MKQNTRHKDIIIAWLNGEEVQYLSGNALSKPAWKDFDDGSYIDFQEYTQYRIKPKDPNKEKPRKAHDAWVSADSQPDNTCRRLAMTTLYAYFTLAAYFLTMIAPSYNHWVQIAGLGLMLIGLALCIHYDKPVKKSTRTKQ